VDLSDIFVVRTTSGREVQVIERVVSRFNSEKENYTEIYAILKPHEIRGYIFIEADSKEQVSHLVYGVTYAKGVVQDAITIQKLEHFFAPVSEVMNIQKEDIIEITSGPFKGEKAKVKRINKIKEEVVVELMEAAVAIPITLKLDSVRVIRRDE